MGQLVSTKEGHERPGKWGKPFIKGPQGGFARNCVADQDGDKIDHVVLAEAGAGETHLVLDRVQDSRVSEDLSKGYYLSHPGRGRGLRFRSNLDCYCSMRHPEGI